MVSIVDFSKDNLQRSSGFLIGRLQKRGPLTSRGQLAVSARSTIWYTERKVFFPGFFLIFSTTMVRRPEKWHVFIFSWHVQTMPSENQVLTGLAGPTRNHPFRIFQTFQDKTVTVLTCTQLCSRLPEICQYIPIYASLLRSDWSLVDSVKVNFKLGFLGMSPWGPGIVKHALLNTAQSSRYSAQRYDSITNVNAFHLSCCSS